MGAGHRRTRSRPGRSLARIAISFDRGGPPVQPLSVTTCDDDGEPASSQAAIIDPTDVPGLLALGEFLLRQVESQQAIRDRWFRYYLLITAGTLAFVTSVLKLFQHTLPHRALYLVVMTTLLLTGSLGFCFYNIYLRQRHNYYQHYRLLARIQESLVEATLRMPYNTFYPPAPPGRYRGADYFTLMAQTLLASAYFGAAAAIAQVAYSQLDDSSAYLGLAGAALAAIIFNLTRRRYDARSA